MEYPRKHYKCIETIHWGGKANKRELIVDFFSENKILIVSDILKGSDEFPVNWMMVVLKKKNENPEWVLKHINQVLNVFGGGEVRITSRGSLRIGKITVQRKGGDAGRETSKMLQFKINPMKLFHSTYGVET